jgi:DNA-binding MarR family transcriptional regulator
MRDELLERLADGLDRLDRRLGRQWGPLTRSQWALMTRLRWGALPVGLLADRLRISTAGTTRMLDKLERAGYIRRVRSTEDLRQVSAELTDEGRAQLQEARRAYCLRLGELTEGFADTEMEAWCRLVERAAPPRHPRP